MSRSRRELPLAARAIYRELCDECFCEGSIPDDMLECARIAGVTIPEMETHGTDIRTRFYLRRGRLRNRTTEQDAVNRFRLKSQKVRSGSL